AFTDHQGGGVVRGDLGHGCTLLYGLEVSGRAEPSAFSGSGSRRGRQHAASSTSAPPMPDIPAMAAPAAPSTTMPSAWSREILPGPRADRQRQTTARRSTYSYPSLKTKKPLLRCAATPATTMVPTTPAAASGVRRPAISAVPAPSSTSTLAD